MSLWLGELEEEQVEVAEERSMCIWLFLAPGSPAMCSVELLELVRLAAPWRPSVFSLELLLSNLGSHICEEVGKLGLSQAQINLSQGQGGQHWPASGPDPLFSLWPYVVSSQLYTSKQKVELHQLLFLARPQGFLWVSSQAVFIPSFDLCWNSASWPVAVSAWLLGPEPRFKQATFSLPSGWITGSWGGLWWWYKLSPSF